MSYDTIHDTVRDLTDLYRNFDLLRRSIGYVPQRDILHEALSVERTLYYAARIRLPSGTSDNQIPPDERPYEVGLGKTIEAGIVLCKMWAS